MLANKKSKSNNMDRLETKLTLETDDARPVSFPSLVVKPTGQRFVFYTKQFTTGRTSNSRVTFTLPFAIDVEAGSGTLNSIPVSWGAATLTAPPDSFNIVYSDSMGVHLTDTWDMALIASSIVLAFVYTGNSEITRVEEVEKTGLYIFTQKQELVGQVWQWSGAESILNTGEQSQAFYDPSSGLIYLHYKKDSSVYLRVLDPLDVLSFRYLPNSYIQDPNTIHLNRDPQASIEFNVGAGDSSSQAIVDVELFPLSVTGLSFQYVISAYEPFIYIPYIIGSYLQYLKYPYTIEIGHLSGSAFVTEDSVTINSNDPYGRWRQWTGSLGLKYIRVRCFTPLMGGEYFTPPSGYKQVFIYDPFEYQETVDNTINEQLITEPVTFRSSGSTAGQIVKTFEYEETRDFEQDSVLFQVGVGALGQLTKTFEYEESRDFEQDTIPAFQVGAGYNATMTLVNT